MRHGDIDLVVRPAERQDARFLAELWAYSFPGEASSEARLGTLLEGGGPHGGLDTCWIAEGEGRPVGGFRTLPLRMTLRGRMNPVQGLAAVAVAPDARRRGVGREMCRRALRLGVENQQRMSALFPFRTSFYADLGYALVGELERHQFSPEALPLFPEYRAARSLSMQEAQELLPAFYDGLLPRLHGPVERTRQAWKHLLSAVEGVCGVPDGDGGLRGYATVDVAHASVPERSMLRVRELLAEDAEAYRSLLGWISAQRSQWGRVQYDASRGERFHKLLSHPRLQGQAPARGLWFPSSVLLRGPMLRILDLPGLLSDERIAERGVLAVRDDEIAENAGIWGWGRGGVQRSQEGTPGEGLPIGLVTELFVEGRLPGQAGARTEWDPALGIDDFRLYDVF